MQIYADKSWKRTRARKRIVYVLQMKKEALAQKRFPLALGRLRHESVLAADSKSAPMLTRYRLHIVSMFWRIPNFLSIFENSQFSGHVRGLESAKW